MLKRSAKQWMHCDIDILVGFSPHLVWKSQFYYSKMIPKCYRNMKKYKNCWETITRMYQSFGWYFQFLTRCKNLSYIYLKISHGCLKILASNLNFTWDFQVSISACLVFRILHSSQSNTAFQWQKVGERKPMSKLVIFSSL